MEQTWQAVERMIDLDDMTRTQRQGARMRMARTLLGIDRDTMAALIGVDSTETIRRYEAGEHSPRFDSLSAIDEVIGTNLVDYIRERSEEVATTSIETVRTRIDEAIASE